MPIQHCTQVRKPSRRFQRGYTRGHTYNARPLRTKIVRSHPMKSDPSRTKTLRKKFEWEIARRASRLARLIVDLIVEEDAFGLKWTFNKERSNDQKPNGMDIGLHSVHPVVNMASLQSATELKQTTNEITGGLSNERMVDEAGKTPVPLIPNKERSNERDNGPGRAESREDTPAAGRDSCGERPDGSGTKGTKRRHSNVGAVFNHNSVLPDNGCVRNSPGSSDIPQQVLNQRFAFQTAPEQLVSFERWLQEQRGVRFGDRADPYWEEFIQEGYEKGAGRAWDDTNRARRALATETEDIAFLRGSKEQFLRDAFAQPETREKISLLASRTFGDLRAVDAQMAALLNRTLSAGLAQGMNPRVIARTMLEGIGLNRDRAQVIARTEIIRAHAEGQLDAMERMGVERVGVMVEWSTAGDDRVCATIFSTVETDHGLVPIQRIKPGDRVKTRGGYQTVTATSSRKYHGPMVTVVSEVGPLTTTADHPYWTIGDGWKEAGQLTSDDVLQSCSDQPVKILRIVNFFLGNTAYYPSMSHKIPVFSDVPSGVAMPISAVDFDRKPHTGYEKVDPIPADGSFLDKLNIQRFQGQANRFLDICLRTGFSTTRHTAKAFIRRTGTDTNLNATDFAGSRNGLRTAATFFGTMFPVHSASYVARFVPQSFAACIASFPFPFPILRLASKRAVVVPACDGLLNRKALSAANANFVDRMATIGIIANAATKRPVTLSGSIDRRVAHHTRNHSPIPVVGLKALARAKTLGTALFQGLRSSLKRLSAVVAREGKRHGYSLLSKLHLLYHKLRSMPIVVYDIQVENHPEFFANGVLVHNCPLCQPLDGVVMKISEARGLIPRHPQCRCAHVPAQVGEPADITRRVNFGKGTRLIRQRKSKAEIEAAFRRSVGAERKKGTLKEKRRRSTWQGADRIGRIAKKRPKRQITPST